MRRSFTGDRRLSFPLLSSLEPDTEKIDRGTAKIIIEMGRLARTQPAKINVDYPDSHPAEFVKQFSIRFFIHLNLPGVLDFRGLLLLLKNKLGNWYIL